MKADCEGLTKLADAALDFARTMVETGFSMPPMLVVCSLDSDGRLKDSKALPLRMSDSSDHARAARLMDALMADPDSPADGLVFVSEGWAKMHIKPRDESEDDFLKRMNERFKKERIEDLPERMEILMIVMRTRDDVTGRNYRIDRVKQTLEPMLDGPTSMKGRMTGNRI